MADVTELAKELWDKVEVDGPIRPDDCLIVRVSSKPMDPKQFQEISTRLADAFKAQGVDVHLIVLSGVEQIQVYRREAVDG